MVRSIAVHEGILALKEVILDRLVKQEATILDEIQEARAELLRISTAVDSAKEQGLDCFDDKVYKEIVLF